MNIDEVSIDLLILIIFFIIIVKVKELLALIDLEDLMLILLRLFDRVIDIYRVFVFSLIDRDLITIILLSTLIASIILS